ncbi:MAG: hypothetical protein WBA41_03620 [Rivularia sp. (in: cyanobacteria)]
MGGGAASVIGDTNSTIEISLEDKILAREVIERMMPVCDSYLALWTNQYKIMAMQGMGIVFLGNFSGMVAGFVLSPPQEINVPKVIGSSLFSGFIGMAITFGRASLNAFTLILKKTREFTNRESN